MYVKIRKLFAKANENDLIINISKMALIQELRKMIYEQTEIDVGKQKLYYKGKELIDDHKIMDYDIQLNDVIQLMMKSESENVDNKSADKDLKKDGPETAEAKETEIETETSTSEDLPLPDDLEKGVSKYFKLDDPIDAIDAEYGGWFEARIVDILKRKLEVTDENNEEPDLIFRIKWENLPNGSLAVVGFNEIKPRSRYTYDKSDLSAGQVVLANYNIEDPTTRGFWYEFTILKIKRQYIKGNICVGKDRMKLSNCKVKYIDEIKKIEPLLPLGERPEDYNTQLPELRKNVYYCEICKDVASKPCKHCGCNICSGKGNSNKIILCDECDLGFHIGCLRPPLKQVPPENEDWYCPSCKNDENEIVKAGDKLKVSNKKAKMASSKQDSNSRDWGRGMACVGRTKECTIVPKNHFGPIPGVDVGMCWKFRVQVSEAGVHRPHVAGIHGRESDGAYSLILSGGYEDDVDSGNEFVYTGSGGRDLSGNKRVSGQSSDQALTRMNKALALNCNARLNKDGAEAENWKKGKPVRVVRNYKINKHSEYGPKDGNRYDGIYKVVKYYPEKGKSGFLVWKYLLRRDDPNPAPWEDEGQELEMVYPPGYLEAQASKTNENEKRKRSSSDEKSSPQKKIKITPFKLDEEIEEAIKNDVDNVKLWEECKSLLEEGKQVFLSKVEEIFTCICCQEIVYLPVLIDCNHIVCRSCLKRSFSAEIFNCPCCRYELGKDFKIKLNENLSKVLLNLFPGYEANR